jgi:hypothetical protein
MSRFLRNSPRFFLPLLRFPAGLAGWHWREGRSVPPSAPHPPSCAPFAPSPLRDFLYYGRSDSCWSLSDHWGGLPDSRV